MMDAAISTPSITNVSSFPIKEGSGYYAVKKKSLHDAVIFLEKFEPSDEP